MSSPTPRVERSVTGICIAAASVMPTTCATSITAMRAPLRNSAPHAAETALPPRPLHVEHAARALVADRGQHGIERSFTAVGHRPQAQFRMGPHATQPVANRRADAGRCERTLE